MRSSGKSRNKNRNNGRRPNPGNVINRVFDSAGPEGKVRGTPQQIIDKYISRIIPIKLINQSKNCCLS